MICVPIVGPSVDQALKDIAQAGLVGDIIELRLDLIQDADLPVLLKAASKPCIVTNRTKLEGGQFKGSEEERVRALRQAMDAGVDYIDIESATPRQYLQPILEARGKTKTILSFHHFSQTPDNLEAVYEIMSETPADILKIIPYARDINDNTVVFNLLARARKDDRSLISFCMGERGEVSRILSPLLGGFLTFGSLDTGKESAPGQIRASTLKDIYRIGLERQDGKVYGVIGDPVSKSMGYLIHNRGFAAMGLPHIYVPFWVENTQKFFPAFEPWFDGLSVTMPHKEKIMSLLDRIDPTAKAIGAVNTVVREADGWAGYNTDCSGAMKALAVHCDARDKDTLIIGSGGTAKAIGYGIVQRGGRLTVTYHKNRERGERLARELNAEAADIRNLGDRNIDILINCSPVGMSPDVDQTPFPARLLKSGMVVFDSVYNPMETRLLREARAAGCTTISGVELFVNQAAEQFEMWTGQKAPTDAMRRVIAEKLSSS
ncbi:MAG: shikimate dehydrogenase [Nitrospinales bacterium]